MISHLKESIETVEALGENVDNTVATPATKNLIVVSGNSTELGEEKSGVLHSVTAKFLFIIKIARPNI